MKSQTRTSPSKKVIHNVKNMKIAVASCITTRVASTVEIDSLIHRSKLPNLSRIASSLSLLPFSLGVCVANT
jgi:hypothetical protein